MDRLPRIEEGVEQLRKENEKLRAREKERIDKVIVELAALNKRLHVYRVYRLRRCYSSLIKRRITFSSP